MSAPRDRVHLLFPPLAATSFGRYYPSTAVLTAFLGAAGISAKQEDLNQQFAEFLLSDDVLALLNAGELCDTASAAAAAARWASRNRGLLADPVSGYLRPAAYGDYERVLGALAKPLTIDPGPSVLLAGDHGVDEAVLSVYREFFRHSGIARRTAGAALVGISVPMGPQLVAALMLTAVIKEADPELKLVLGGPALSLMDPADLDTLLRQHRTVDAVVRFDGELPLLALTRQALDGRWTPLEVAGVSALAGDTVSHRPPAAGPDVNRLPYPLYSQDLLARLSSPTLAVTQARGCYWGKCDYCDFIELFDGSAPFRGRHPDSFVAELEHLIAEHNVTRFTFITESIPPAFARRMSTLILDRGLKIRWTSFAMVDRRFDRSLLELMGRAGCDSLVIGMETMITRVLKLVHKSADREENIRFLKDAKAAGVKLRVNLIPDLPSTTYEEALECLEDLRGLSDYVASTAVFPFEPTRSSNVGRNPGRFGLLPLADADDTGIMGYTLNHLQSTDPAMTDTQRAEVHRRYAEFQEWINGGAAHRDGSQLPDGTPLRVPAEDLDVIELDGQTICRNLRTLDRVTIPSRIAPLVQPYLSGRPLTLTSAAAGQVTAGGEAAGGPLSQEVLALYLASAGLLVPSGPLPGREAPISL
jgi:hypothetical protein